MNRDIQIQNSSDYLLRLELLGQNNEAYDFGIGDSLKLQFSDVKGSKTDEVELDISEFENPLSHVITQEFLEQFSSDPVKYKLVLIKPDITLTLLFGNIYRED